MPCRHRSGLKPPCCKIGEISTVRRRDPSNGSPAIDPEASECQVAHLDSDDGLCGAVFLMIEGGPMDLIVYHPAKGEPYSSHCAL